MFQMNPLWVGRLAAWVLLGFVGGVWFHYYRARYKDLNLEGFLDLYRRRYEKLSKQRPYGWFVEILAFIIMAGIFLGAYEVIGFGISKLTGAG